MRPLRRFARQLAFVVVFAAVLGAAWGFVVVRRDIESVRTLQQESLIWASSQLQSEYLRLMRSLVEYQAEVPKVDAKAVNLRFDIFWSRIEVLRQGQVGRLVMADPETAARVERLALLVREWEATMVGLADAPAEAIDRMRAELDAVEPNVRQISLNLLEAQTDRESRQHDALVGSSALLTFFSATTGVVTLLLVAIYAADARRERARRRQTLALLDAARRGEEARSRFLSMMSHELRTPMNGVLGMIALARQPGLPQPQDAALEQAAASARDMNGLLTDLVELAAVGTDTARQEIRPVAPVDYARTLQSELMAGGLQAGVTLLPGAPQQVLIDARPTARLMIHLGSYLRDAFGAGKLDMELDFTPERMRVIVRSDGPDDWDMSQPAAEAAPRPELSATAIRREIARGYLERINGEIDRHEDGGLCLVLPLHPRSALRLPRVVLKFRTGSLRTIISAALQGDAEVLEGEDAGAGADVVFVEVGEEDLHKEVAELRRNAPSARIVGVGAQRPAEHLDGWLRLPLERGAVQRSLLPDARDATR